MSAPTVEQFRSPSHLLEPAELTPNRPLRRTVFFERLVELLKKLIFTLLVLGVVAFLYYRYALAPIAVRSHRIAAGELVAEVMGTGTLEARVKVTVSAKIVGQITDVLVDQGDQVQAGQLLIRLDDDDFRRQVEVEQANVAFRNASLDRLVADKAYAAANLDLAADNHERMTRLLPTRAIAQEDFDETAGALAMAKAALDQAEAALVEGQKQLVAAEQTLEYQKARLDDTVITAPFDGLIVRRDRDPGDVVVPGTSVLQLISLKEVWVRAWVDETEMARLQPEQPAGVVFRSEPDVTYDGHISRLGRESDRETREFLVDVLPTKLPANWSVGQRVEVYIETARKSDALLLPAQFLVRAAAGEAGTFVVAEGKATWHPVTLGLRGRQAVEVVAGLQPGDMVIAPMDPKAEPLSDGKRVAVR